MAEQDGITEVTEDWEHVEKSLQLAGIGAKLRRLRLRRSMGLVEVGKMAGLSASYLSQLETGRVIPTLRNLARIALVFKIDLSHFFKTRPENTFRIARASTRSRLTSKKSTGTMISESMSILIPDRSLVPCIAEFPVSESADAFLPQVFEGEEFLFVLSGALIVRCSLGEETLHSEDVLWIDGNQRREYRCDAGQTARVMIISCPRQPQKKR